jgi:predicted transcriptional regulator
MLAKHCIKLKKLHRKLGAQAVVWYLLASIFTDGARFSQLKEAYELIRGKQVRKATIAVILRRMAKKGLVRKASDGKYYPLVTREEVAFSRIDRKRVRIAQPVRILRKEEKREASTLEKLLHEPYVAKLAFRRAQKIAWKHGKLAAGYFLVFSLVGARETGYLLLWLNAMFVYCEQKTGFCHYFYSQLLHHYFQLLGLKQGIMYKHSQEHLEAMKIANKCVRKHYGSHPSSRRLHYELNYIEYDDNEIYTLEIIHYHDGDLGVRLWDNNTQETLHKENITSKPVSKREIKPAYPYEHVHEPNEQTYFHRPGRIY